MCDSCQAEKDELPEGNLDGREYLPAYLPAYLASILQSVILKALRLNIRWQHTMANVRCCIERAGTAKYSAMPPYTRCAS